MDELDDQEEDELDDQYVDRGSRPENLASKMGVNGVAIRGDGE